MGAHRGIAPNYLVGTGGSLTDRRSIHEILDLSDVGAAGRCGGFIRNRHRVGKYSIVGGDCNGDGRRAGRVSSPDAPAAEVEAVLQTRPDFEETAAHEQIISVCGGT